MSKADDEEVVRLEARIHQLEVKRLEYEGLHSNVGLMVTQIKNAILDAKEQIKGLGKSKAASG